MTISQAAARIEAAYQAGFVTRETASQAHNLIRSRCALTGAALSNRQRAALLRAKFGIA